MHVGEPEELFKLELFKIEKLLVAERPFYRLAVPDWGQHRACHGTGQGAVGAAVSHWH